MLDNATNQLNKFREKNCVNVTDDRNGVNVSDKKNKFKNSVLKPCLYDHINA